MKQMFGESMQTPHRGQLSSAMPPTWRSKPFFAEAGQKLCVFVSYSPRGLIKEHVEAYISQLRRHGYVVVLVLTVDHYEEAIRNTEGFSRDYHLAVRRNAGFDFGAWAATMSVIDGLWDVASLTLVNDSVFGPMSSFGEMLRRIDKSDADVISLIDSYEGGKHFQSFYIVFKNESLKSEAIMRFWRSIVDFSDKNEVINEYELNLRTYVEDAGLKADILFPIDSYVRSSPERFGDNPTLVKWRALLNAGFPFVKVQLLRDNPHADLMLGWRQALRDAGADVDMIVRQLSSVGNATGLGVVGTSYPKLLRRYLKTRLPWFGRKPLGRLTKIFRI